MRSGREKMEAAQAEASGLTDESPHLARAEHCEEKSFLANREPELVHGEGKCQNGGETRPDGHVRRGETD